MFRVWASGDFREVVANHVTSHVIGHVTGHCMYVCYINDCTHFSLMSCNSVFNCCVSS